MPQWVHSFNLGQADRAVAPENRSAKVLGGKGASLARMSGLGLPVPPGFTIVTDACAHVLAKGGRFPRGLEAEVKAALARLEKTAGARFGGAKRPLLLSVRSGAAVSMPGMMDTVLNLGLNDQTVLGLAADSGDAEFAFGCYRRFIAMYATVVLGVPEEDFADCPPDAARAHLDAVARATGHAFPQDPWEQLWGAIRAVFLSWLNPRARAYRALHGLAEEGGTAVTVQAMVFGNRDARSATGVAHTRDPMTGENRLGGEYLPRAQGEELVAGRSTPLPLTGDERTLEKAMPAAFRALKRAAATLEAEYGQMQEIEFTIERGKLFLLQTRATKPSAAAAIRIAVELAQSHTITRAAAIVSIEPRSLERLLHPRLDPAARRDRLGRGLPAAPGAASGAIVFTAAEAMARAEAGERVLLVRAETSPEDIRGMHAAEGILTTRGGMTSHAAVVARGMGRPCIVGAGELAVDAAKGQLTARGRVFAAGSVLTLDGASGEVFAGSVATIEPELSPELATLLGWADAARRLKVRVNAETPEEVARARRFGAEGIGLARSEQMTRDPASLLALRRMILATGPEGRRQALRDLLPLQRAAFKRLFLAAAGWPVTVRLFDAPLHEFLPQGEAATRAFIAESGADATIVAERLAHLAETNPMLGHRGCRLGITYPEIYEAQARALLEAALDAEADSGARVAPEIMIPLAATGREVELVRSMIDGVAAAVASERGKQPAYSLGCMIELQRAALCAGELARAAAFFSFGTNDLTQTSWGLSRDDAAPLLQEYERRGVIAADPFVAFDRDGVGELMALATARGRVARPELLLGICGEHGGDPDAIAFCEQLKLDYVSCSPFRVLIARLAAAQAGIKSQPQTETRAGRAAPRRRSAAPTRKRPQAAKARARARRRPSA
ncbi:MAG: pyruvate, phosphate dikinase [Alphaproteobacteria bacterium]|nr:pyruvate, phosphate dikinase [Alphaproteobacteria bacterium]